MTHRLTRILTRAPSPKAPMCGYAPPTRVPDDCQWETIEACEPRDGWSTTAGESDDDDSIHAGADEHCDGKDNDCDGETDADADGLSTCDGDCDDSDGDVHGLDIDPDGEVRDEDWFYLGWWEVDCADSELHVYSDGYDRLSFTGATEDWLVFDGTTYIFPAATGAWSGVVN